MKKRPFLFRLFFIYLPIASGIIGFFTGNYLLTQKISVEEGGYYSLFGNAVRAYLPLFVLLACFGFINFSRNFMFKTIVLVLGTILYCCYIILLLVFVNLCIDACSGASPVPIEHIVSFEFLFALIYLAVTVVANFQIDKPPAKK